ncbi:M48 family metalloprotease [Calditrichota bacterium]
MKSGLSSRFSQLAAMIGLITVLLIMGASVGQTQEVLVRDGVFLRSGPGNFYQISKILNSSAVFTRVDSVEGWLKIKVDEIDVGWISKNALGGSAPIAPKSQLESAHAVVGKRRSVDGTALGAMIKGLKADLNLEVAISDPMLMDGEISESTVKDFRSTLSNNSSPLSAVDYGMKMVPEYMAIAPVLAMQQVDEWDGAKSSVQTYSNQLLLWISNCVNLNSLAPRVYVCNSGSNAICYPGGWIVIGNDLFEYVADEAEFAAVMAHELGHAVMHHGRKSLETESWRIRSDDVFAELDSETDHEAGEGEIDLENYALEVLSQARRRWQIGDELQSDSCAVVWLAASGYNPEAMLTLLQKMRAKFGEGMLGQKNLSVAWVSSRDELETRIKRVEKQLRKFKKQMKSGIRLQNRFMQQVKY